MALSPCYVALGELELYREDQFFGWHRGLCIDGNLRPVAADTSGIGCARPAGGWTNPAVDGAWWCYSGSSEAGEVAGLIITSLTGLDESKYKRDMVDLAGCGSTFGRPIVTGRRIEVRGQVRAKSCNGLDFYLRALDYQLRNGFGCGSGCDGADLTWLAASPAVGTSAADTAKLVRMIPNVTLVEGVRVEARRTLAQCSCPGGACAGNVADVVFVLGSKLDDIYQPAHVAGGTCADGSLQSFAVTSICKTWRWVSPSGSDCVTPDAQLSWDEDCFPTVVRPTRVTSVLNCACEAVAYTFGTCQVTNPHPFSPLSLVIEVRAGSAPIRGWRVKGFRLPDWLPCPSTTADIIDVEANYEPEFGLVIPSLPAGAIVKLDAVRGQYTVQAAGRTLNARRYVYGLGGLPFRLPTVAPCDRICLVVEANGCSDVSTSRWLVAGMASGAIAGASGVDHPTSSDGTWGGSSAALTLGPTSGTLANRLAGSAAALTLGKNSGVLSNAVTGSTGAMILGAGSGSWTYVPGGSPAALTLAPASGALALRLVGSAAALTLAPASGGLSNLAAGSSGPLVLGPAGGSFGPGGAATWSGSSLGLSLTLGTGSGAIQFRLPGSAAALTLVPGAGTITGAGTVSWAGSSAPIALGANPGVLAATSAALWSGSVGALTLAATSGRAQLSTAASPGALTLVPGPGGAFGSTGTVALAGSSDVLTLDPGAGALFLRLPGGTVGLTLTPASGVFSATGSVALAGNARALTIAATSGTF